MARIDRYMLSQFLVLFGFFSLVLVLIYWINRAVILFDQLIADGQSAGVFLEFTALALPNMIRLVLPIAAFASAVYVTNRLTTESELTVMQATGHSAFRLARPVVIFGLIVAGLMSLLVHLLVPVSQAWEKDREAEIAENVTARLLSEGEFLSPAQGITFYIRDITPEGELQDIFLHETRRAEEHVTYTAARAYLLRGPTGPQLVMIDGMAQNLNTETGRLFVTRFDDFAYDISTLMTSGDRTTRRMRELWTGTLLRGSPQTQTLTGESRAELVHEGHNRILQSLLSIIAPLIGFTTLISGKFSRFGVWRQIVLAIFLLVLIKTVESMVPGMIEGRADLWPMVYLPFVLGLAIAWAQLWSVSRSRRLRRVAA